MYPWTRERIEWYQRAVDQTGFDRILADMAQPWLEPGERVCDLGCGTGYLALELARRGFQVTAVDRSALCMSWLRGQKEAQGLSGLEILEQDWRELAGREPWDHVVMVFAGRPDQDLKDYLSLCRRGLILVVKTGQRSHVQPAGVPPRFRRDADGLEETIRRAGLDYTRRDRVVDFGQPLRSREEAARYLAAFEVTGAGAEDTLSRLEETGDDAFPFRLPAAKELAMFVIRKTGPAEGLEV